MEANPVAANPVVGALARRARSSGSQPLLTWYLPKTGGRTELSVRTFANWVDKAANLLGSLGVEGPVAGPLSVAHPGHWMSLVWPLAAWQHGSAWIPGEPDGDEELVVVGPDAAHSHPGATTIACSLHPLALGLRDLPAGVLDFTGEALAQPDAHWAEPVAWSQAAWVEGGRERTHADTGAVEPQAARVLVRPTTAWDSLAAAVLGPVLGGGSAVVVDGPAEAATLSRIAASEHAAPAMA